MKTLREMIRPCIATGWLVLTLGLSACGGGGSGADASPPVNTPPVTIAAPSISTAPVAATVQAGQPASFAVSATGTGPLTYQWQRNGADIPGATASTYTLPATAVGDSGAQFLVRVTNSGGTTSSAAALLTVQALEAASIVAPPVGVTVSAGTAATFSVQAQGSNPVSYQWQRDGTDIAGATSSTYTLPSTSVADTGALFRVVVSNASGGQTSPGALLTVVSGTVAAPTISTQPESATLLDGDIAVLSVAAAGTGPFSYQWRRNGTPIPGAVTDLYISNFLTLADSGAVYSVVVSNGGGSVTSANATIRVNVRPIDLFVKPVPATAAPGEIAAFVVLATGSDPKTYQWLRNGTPLPGATSALYNTPTLTAADNGALYSVVVTNAAGSVTSPTALLTVAAPAAPTIGTQPANVTVTEGLPATFSVVATGTGTLRYQWRRNGTNISGATEASYTVARTVAADNAARFSVVVSNNVGPVTSTDAVLNVQTATGPLIGRAWAAPQSLEENTSVVNVLDHRTAIDDAGNVTVLFRKNNGTRDAIYATRGVPNGAGQAPTWSAPAVIDVLAGAPVSSMGNSPDYSLMAAPGGDLVALWYHSAACSASTYRTSGTCRFYHFARYRAATNTWEVPVLLADASNPGFAAFINDRGDLAFIGNSWVRSGTNSFTTALALFMRAAGETTTRRQLLNAEPINAYQLNMDAAGNLLMAAQLQQNATTDLVAYRGTAAVGLGAFQVLDTRGAAATLRAAGMGLNGQQVVVWSQNNGTEVSMFGATASSSTGAWATQDLGSADQSSSSSMRLTVDDSGNALLMHRTNGWFKRWQGGVWQPYATLPAGTPTSSFLSCSHARNGNFLCLANSSFGGDSNSSVWVTYDAARNVLVQPRVTTSPGAGFVLGFNTINLGIGLSAPQLSISGVAVATLQNSYDVLPTPTARAGDGRNVTNLWGTYLK